QEPPSRVACLEQTPPRRRIGPGILLREEWPNGVEQRPDERVSRHIVERARDHPRRLPPRRGGRGSCRAGIQVFRTALGRGLSPDRCKDKIETALQGGVGGW